MADVRRKDLFSASSSGRYRHDRRRRPADHYEVELPLVMVSALEELRVPACQRRPCTRTTASCPKGFYRGLA